MFFRKLINLVLYSNLWIALGAFLLVFEYQILFEIERDWTLPLFCGFATLLIYAAHRIVGLEKVAKFHNEGRFRVIVKYKSHIWFYAVCSFFACCYLFFQLPFSVQLALVPPGIISVGYVVPILGKQKKRLRDFHFIKIFQIAVVWAFVTVILPYLAYGGIENSKVLFLVLERILFLFAITIPFDVRDLEIDSMNKVYTIPAYFGTKKSLNLALVCLFVAFGIDAFLFGANFLIANLVFYIITALLVGKASPEKHDYYYTGLLDGTLVLKPILMMISFWYLLGS